MRSWRFSCDTVLAEAASGYISGLLRNGQNGPVTDCFPEVQTKGTEGALSGIFAREQIHSGGIAGTRT